MRTILSVILAAVVTAGLLFCMSLLIKDQHIKEEEPPPTVELSDITIPEEKPKPTPEVVKPPQPPAIEPAPKSDGDPIDTSEIDAPTEKWVSIETPDVIGLPDGIGDVPAVDFSQESEAMPMYRTQPNYPIMAQQRGLEGWVLLTYDVDTSGTLSNIAVMDSEPRKIFDREAMRALRKWKFKPAMTNGQPIASVGQTVKIEFNMDQE
ncbi:energy transducer TonB [Kangiella taiwanensis]|uniref:Protein TonB n=1 Tax=Kangiella taiwanensis TaxID=1079179 RepID=A0ABP8I3L9_9GAMM|nr:energy transducer TonB [Kangiella taiwanensis]